MTFSKRCIYALVILLPQITIAQLDMSRYASEDFLEVKPVINLEQLPTESEEETSISQIEHDFQEAFDLWNNGKSDEAIQAFENLEFAYGENIGISYYLAAIYFEQ